MDSSDGEDFGQESPPISEIITGIINDYPSGQIFKVSSRCTWYYSDYGIAILIMIITVSTCQSHFYNTPMSCGMSDGKSSILIQQLNVQCNVAMLQCCNYISSLSNTSV